MALGLWFIVSPFIFWLYLILPKTIEFHSLMMKCLFEIPGYGKINALWFVTIVPSVIIFGMYLRYVVGEATGISQDK